ncbi:MAG: hypothetical protein ACMUHX_11180, partial [bacterium]
MSSSRLFFPETWHGFRLLATDGSTIKVPRTEEASAYFGTWNPPKGERCPVARVSQLFDVLNHITIDVLIAPKSRGERNLYSYQIGWTQALAKMKNVGILLFIRETIAPII